MWWVEDGNWRNRKLGKCPEPEDLEENEAESQEIEVRVPVGFPTQIEAFWKSERFKRSLYRTSCEQAQSQTLRFAQKANTTGGGQDSEQREIPCLPLSDSLNSR